MEKKPKILFWLNADFSNFAIAYFLQKKINADFYAIIDVTKKPKKFFEQQKNITTCCFRFNFIGNSTC